ncbi:MAG: DUF1015 domain-containing protein [Lachnospiraceae bacterium]|nr:DUF1015 domain-containing protein [Lachnospiraceae bacterium]
MAVIRPFRAIRPRTDLARDIAALPYDVFTRQEAEAEVRRSPLSFLRVDRPETNFNKKMDIYDDKVYEKAKELLDGMVKDGSLVEDEKPMYYVYELSSDKHVQSGLVCCVTAQDYEKGIVKKHENTRADKEKDRIRHVDACNAQTGPILMGYRGDERVTEILSRVKQSAPEVSFKCDDGISHSIWPISLDRDIRSLTEIFEGIDRIYICDGHHRCASAAKVAAMRKAAEPDWSGEEEYNYIMSVLFAEDELQILDYNRIVRDLNGLSEDRFIDRVRKKFSVEKVGRQRYRPEDKHHFGMYLSGCWYHLIAKPETILEDPVERMDVSILQNEILGPILGIEDERTDPRIGFLGGIHGLSALERKVNAREYDVAFALFPTSIEELFDVADAGLLMPPKSTWFEPKLRSGLFIHAF